MYAQSKTKKNSEAAWLGCISVALFFFFNMAIMVMEGVFKDVLQAKFNLRSETLYITWIGTAFHGGNFLFVLPAAYLLGMYSVRNITLSAIGLSLLGVLGMALSDDIYVFGCCRFLVGAANAFCFLCMSTLITRWFSPDKRGTMTGIAVAIGLSGIMFCQFLGRDILETVGDFDNTLLVFLMIGLFIGMMVYLFVFDYPAGEELLANRASGHSLGYLKEALLNEKNWHYAAYAAFMNAPYMVLIIYLSPFLQHVHHINHNVMLWLSLGNILGGAIVGLVAQWWQSNKKPMIVASCMSMVLLLLFFFYPPSHWLLLGALAFVLGVMISAQVLSYPSIAEENPTYMVASAMSVASLVVIGSIPFFQTVTGRLFDYCRHGATKEYFVYSSKHYVGAFAPFVIAVGLAIMIAITMEETFQKVATEKEMKERSKLLNELSSDGDDVND